MRICPNCGSVIKEGNFCPACGSQLEPEPEDTNVVYAENSNASNQHNQSGNPNQGGFNNSESAPVNRSNQAVGNKKSPTLAVILSFLIVGLGQVYLGLGKKGVILFIIQMIFGILALVYIGYILAFLGWIYAMLDAYYSAKAINNGEEVENTVNFKNLLWWR